MKLHAAINTEGFVIAIFTETKIVEDKTLSEKYELVKFYEGNSTFTQPKYNKELKKWEEGASAEFIATQQENLRVERFSEINRVVNDLSIGAIAIIIDEKGLSNEELHTRRELYNNLYQAAKDTTEAYTVFLEIKRAAFNNANGLDLDLQAYKNIIIQKWEEGLSAEKQIKLMIEAVRSKWQSVYLDNNKYNAIANITETLNEDTEPTQLQSIFNQIMSV